MSQKSRRLAWPERTLLDRGWVGLHNCPGSCLLAVTDGPGRAASAPSPNSSPKATAKRAWDLTGNRVAWLD